MSASPGRSKRLCGDCWRRYLADLQLAGFYRRLDVLTMVIAGIGALGVAVYGYFMPADRIVERIVGALLGSLLGGFLGVGLDICVNKLVQYVAEGAWP